MINRADNTDSNVLIRSAQNLGKDLSKVQVAYERYRQVVEDEHELRITAEEELAAIRQSNSTLKKAVSQVEEDLDRERIKGERFRNRAERLSVILKSMHRSLFSGDISQLLLSASLSLTGAKRGLYVSTLTRGRQFRVRSAVNVAGYPESQPSAFILALCKKVLDEKDSFVCNSGAGPSDISEPERAEERWTNYVVAPVVLLKEFDGIIIIADKPDGGFEEDDVETLLSVGDQAGIAVENKNLQRKLQSAYLSTVSVLADAVQAKDPYTHGHCELVSKLARFTANEMNLSDDEKDIVCYAALLHDVGKIGVSDGVLNKPGTLQPEELELVRSHVRVGHDLLSHVPALEKVADIVLHHHEWFDGSGYPDGQSGEDIPVAARIVAVVDAYCAMITRRSYKEAYGHEESIAELIRCAGTQFDPQVVEAFINIQGMLELLEDDSDNFAECGMLPGFRRLLNEVAVA